MSEHKPHPANVPGDFYVEDGCCTMCLVPFTEAPELFGECQDPKGYPQLLREAATGDTRRSKEGSSRPVVGKKPGADPGFTALAACR